jgi:hypothetical protein
MRIVSTECSFGSRGKRFELHKVYDPVTSWRPNNNKLATSEKCGLSGLKKECKIRMNGIVITRYTAYLNLAVEPALVSKEIHS